MIEITGLRKRYGSFTAVKGIDLSVRAGEIFGFLGPNGAGKTTTMKMLTGLLRPTEGQITVKGMNLAQHPIEARRLMGYIPDRPYLYEKLTALEYLSFIGEIYGMAPERLRARRGELLAFFGLGDRGDELVEAFSHGMKQRLCFAGALLHEPDILVVDEPMVGLDPAGALLIKRVFTTFAEEGGTVFLSTHSLGVAEELAHRMAIIKKGEIVARGTIDELRALRGGGEGEEGHPNLEQLFLELVGGAEMAEIERVLRRET